MSVKKLLVLSAAAFAAIGVTAAIAGGPDSMAMHHEDSFQNSLYLEGHFGYAQSNWANNNSNRVMGNNVTSVFSPTSHGKGYITGGLDLGYNITQHIAVEGGWFYLPKVSGHGTGSASANINLTSANAATIKSWLAYVAAKLSVPVMENFDLFGKVGVGYRALNYSYSGPTTASLTTLRSLGVNGHYWAPVFGAGMQYNWNSWIFGAQYLYVPGNDAVNSGSVTYGAPDAAPEVNLYTGFVGYKFNV